MAPQQTNNKIGAVCNFFVHSIFFFCLILMTNFDILVTFLRCPISVFVSGCVFQALVITLM